MWVTSPDTCNWVEDAGIIARPAGLAQGERMAQFWRDNPEARALPPDRIPDVMYPRMFGAIAAPAMLAELLPLAREWSPDLVVHDAAELAAPLVAAAIGIPSVVKSFGAVVPSHRLEAAGELVAPWWHSLGLEPGPFAGCYRTLYLDVYPPGLRREPTHVGRRQLLRPVSLDIAAVAPVVPPLPGIDRVWPLVYLTMGTVFNSVAALSAAVRALSQLEIGLLVTVGPDGDPAALGPQPANVLIERYVPQTSILPRCAVVGSHGGSGTVLGALGLGIPQLCLPQGADQFGNAEAIAGCGAGLMLHPGDALEEAIAGAVARLLTETSFRTVAGQFRETIAAMPGPDDVAEVLETLV